MTLALDLRCLYSRRRRQARPVGTKCILAVEELLVKHVQWDG